MNKSIQALTSLKLNELYPDLQEEVLEQFGDLIFKEVVLNCLEAVADSERETFGKLLESDTSEEKVLAWIEKNVPNADALVQKSIDSISSDILSVTKA